MPTMAMALDKKRTISKDELSNSYGTINKKYDNRRPRSSQNNAPLFQQQNAPSQIEKGSFAYSMGIDAAQSGDLESAVRHWRLSSNEGNFFATWQLARVNLGDFNTQKNDQDAIKYLQLVVAQYDISSESRVRRQISADAMVELAIFYTLGSKPASLNANLPVALKLLNLASSSVGHSKANYLLGELYFNDKFIRPQKKRAVRHYTLAARKNYFSAQIKLGQIYYLHGKNLKARIRGLAWLLVARKNKTPELQNYADDIIARSEGKKLVPEQVKIAQNLADRLSRKWNF